MSRVQRSYDHRLRDLVRRTGDVALATSAGVPRSTASGWLRGRSRPTVTLDVLSIEEEKLQAEVLRLRCRVDKLRALARISSRRSRRSIWTWNIAGSRMPSRSPSCCAPSSEAEKPSGFDLPSP